MYNDFTPVRVYDLFGYGKPKSGTAGFVCDKRPKQIIQVFRRNAAAVVTDGDGQISCIRMGTQGDKTIFRDRFKCIAQKI